MKTLALLFLAALSLQDALVEQETAPEKVKRTGSLGTRGYAPREKEKAFFEKLDPDERTNGSMLKGDYAIKGKKGKAVSWFGIVREVKTEKDRHEILLDHKYFDGLTDTHIMALSFHGSGDFKATLQAKELKLETLVLARVYGTVEDEKEGVPSLKATYLRVFPWKTFTFLACYGEDRTNEKWKKLCTIDEEKIYNPWPDDDYYVKRLGPREKK